LKAGSFEHRQAVGGAHARRSVELDGLEAAGALAQRELEVASLSTRCCLDFEFVDEQRRREALAPDFVFQQARGFERDVAGFERAVGFQRARQVGGFASSSPATWAKSSRKVEVFVR
jgi:hypothetical protein